MKKKILISIILIFVIIGTLFLISACSNKSDEDVDYANIDTITVDPEQGLTFAIGSFDISNVLVTIKYKDTYDDNGNLVQGETLTVNAEYSKVKAEHKALLQKVGAHQITLIYGKFEVTFTLTLLDQNTTFYYVNFYDQDGETKLCDTQKIASGNRATAPNVPDKTGYTFMGWLDMNNSNLPATFENITKNMDFKASYKESTYSVSFYTLVDSAETLIDTVSFDYDYALQTSDFPTPPSVEGYTFSGWHPGGVNVYYAQYSLDEYDITFKYREYKNGKYTDSTKTLVVEYSSKNSTINEIANAKAPTISENNDYQFMYWYVERNGEKVKIDFPYQMPDGMYEMTFNAYYIDMNKGNEEIKYKTNAQGCSVVSYTGTDTIVIIPKIKVINGEKLKVTDVIDGAFKSAQVDKFVVSSDNEYFAVDEYGVLYSKDYSILYAYPANSANIEYTIKPQVTEINAFAFLNAKNLSTVNFNSNLLTIGDNAFNGCDNLTSIVISENVTYIGESCFKSPNNAGKLVSVTFAGTNINEIADEAFYGQKELIRFDIPESLSTLGDGVFYGCLNLETVTAKNNLYFMVENGILYSKDQSTLYLYPSNYKGATNPKITLPFTVSTILKGAFYYANIKSIEIESLDDIFLESYSIICPTLESVILTDFYGGADYTGFRDQFLQAFGDYSPKYFYVDESLDLYKDLSFDGVETVVLNSIVGYPDIIDGFIYSVDNEVASIDGYIGNAIDIEIPTNIGGYIVRSISDNAFNNNDRIMSVKISVTVESIGEYAFYDCDNLETVILSDSVATSLTTIKDHAFDSCDNLSNVVSEEPHSLTNFGQYVFENTYIKDNAGEFFIICGVLIEYNGSSDTVIIPNTVTYIATDAFKGKGFITSLYFEETSKVRYIDSYAFMNCTGLLEIAFPFSLKEINEFAFYGCIYLFKVTYQNTSSNINVHANAYYHAATYYADETVYEEYSNTTIYRLQFNVLNSNYPLSGIAFTAAPETALDDLNTQELFAGWFYDEEFTRIVTFPLSITEDTTIYAKIQDASYMSSGLSYTLNEDQNFDITGYINGTDEYVVVPVTHKDIRITGIGENVFGENVVNIYLPADLSTTTGKNVSKIVSVGIDAFKNTAWYKNYAGDFVIYDNILIGYKGTNSTVIIPDDVSIIAEGVFMNNVDIKYVVLPDSVVTIPKDLFNGCTSLEKVVLGKDVIEIDERAFNSCKNLSSINLENLENLYLVASDAFDGTKWLNTYNSDMVIIQNILYKYLGSGTSLHIPSKVTSIAAYAFAGNTTLRTVYIPSSVTIIRDHAFYNLRALTDVVLFEGGNALAYVMEYAFANCENLGTINFKKSSLVEIRDFAFQNCMSITSLYLPNTVAVLGEAAFSRTGLVSVEVESGSILSEIGKSCFYFNSSLNTFKFLGSGNLSVIGAYAFYNCRALSSFYAQGTKTTTLEEYAFYDCQSLVDIKLNETSLTTIGENAIYNLGYIKTENTNMVLLGTILVEYKGQEERVVVPNKVTTIYDSAFENNTSIKELAFESDRNLLRINTRAFYGCTSLSSINFPVSVRTIGYQAFEKTIWLDEQLEDSEFVIVNNVLVKYNPSITTQAVIPDTVATIIKGAFAGTSVYDIYIPSTVTTIEDGAFMDIAISNWKEGGASLAGFTLTLDALTPPSIGYTTGIDNCVAIYLASEDVIETYRLNTNWQTIGEYNNIDVLKTYTLKYNILSGEGQQIKDTKTHALYEELQAIPTQTLDKEYVFIAWFSDESRTTPLVYPLILTGDTTIYAKFVDYSIGSNPGSFYLDFITGNSGDSTILAYYNYTDTKVVIITEQGGSTVKSITGALGYIGYNGNEYQKYVFDSENKEYLEYDEYRDEGVQTYRKNDIIKEVAFAKNCKIEEIGEYAFAGMIALETITIPSSVKRIASNAFEGCVNLKNIIFEDGISNLSIEKDAFEDCISLTSIYLPSGVLNLADGAFSGCINLTSVHLEAITPINLYNDALPFELLDDLVIYVPLGTRQRYQATWKPYAEYIQESANN